MRFFIIYKFFSWGIGNKQEKENTTWLSLSLSLSLSLFYGFFVVFHNPLFCGNLLLFYRHFYFPYLSSWPALSRIFWGYLSHLPLVLPLFIMKQDFWGEWGVSILFRLSNIYLMWKRLGKAPFINVEVTIFVIFIPLRGFPRQVQLEWHLG